MGITIRDVAARAGVSASTVSLVLNNKPGIGENTRERVWKTAESLGYKLPGIRRQKKTGGMISFLKIVREGRILNRNHNVFISDYIEGIETAARDYGFRLEVKNYASFDPEQITRELGETNPAGVVVLATELNQEDIPLFEKIGIPLVFIDACHPFSFFDFVDMDNEGAVYSIVAAMKEKGHRKIGLVKASFETRNFRLREKGFYDALEYYGLENNKKWEYTVDSTFENALEDMGKQLKKGRELPTAFFCVCDIIAYGCMRALQEEGLQVPGDISVAGFDDLPASLLANPPLTSVKVSKKRIGRRAFQLLIRRLEAAAPVPYEKIYIGSELILRRSLAASRSKKENHL